MFKKQSFVVKLHHNFSQL